MNTSKFRSYNVPAFRSVNFFDDFVTRDLFGRQNWTGTKVPSANVKESNEQFTIELASPGMEKSDFIINVDENVLTISSEKKSEKNAEGEKFTRKEFSFSSFSRSFTLPETIERESIKASYENGILKIELPKRKEEAKSNRVQIEIA